MRVAVLSDTHNLLRKEVLEEIRGCELILHGGDISNREVLDTLVNILPVRVVRGNNDGNWAEDLPSSDDFELCGRRIYMTHKKKDLPENLMPYDMVIVGHSHRYSAEWMQHSDGKQTLVLNPGSCGPRRFYQPVTMALVNISPSDLMVTRVDIPNGVEIPRKPAEKQDLRRQIETVIREMEKSKTVLNIAEKHNWDRMLVEQIARIVVTHPGVTVDEIMSKMGL